MILILPVVINPLNLDLPRLYVFYIYYLFLGWSLVPCCKMIPLRSKVLLIAPLLSSPTQTSKQPTCGPRMSLHGYLKPFYKKH